MAEQSIRQHINDDMKACMKAREKERLAVIRLIQAAIKQREVDERIELNDEQLLVLLDKMAKQRRESITQFTTAGRTDLVEQEQYELEVIQQYLPAQLGDDDIAQLISDAIAQTGATDIKDMGKVMGVIKPKVQGRADMGAVSAKIKAQLSQ